MSLETTSCFIRQPHPNLDFISSFATNVQYSSLQNVTSVVWAYKRIFFARSARRIMLYPTFKMVTLLVIIAMISSVCLPATVTPNILSHPPSA